MLYFYSCFKYISVRLYWTLYIYYEFKLKKLYKDISIINFKLFFKKDYEIKYFTSVLKYLIHVHSRGLCWRTWMRTPPRTSVVAKFHHMYSKDLGHPDSKQTDCRSEDTIKIGQSAESLHGQLFKNLSHKTKSSNQFKCSVQKCHWRLIWVFKKKRGGGCYLYFNIVVFSKLQTTKRI